MIPHKFSLSDREELTLLQQEINNRSFKVTDVALLNKVLSLLRKSNISNISRMAFNKDSDGAKFVNRLSEIIIGLPVPLNEKVEFLRNYGRTNYIDALKLFDGTGEIRSMKDWWTGSGMATIMFKMMIDDPELVGKRAGDAGPGEVAIAVFHRDIEVGTNAANGYDLRYKSDEIEVKTKASEISSSGGGRWTSYNAEPLLTYANSSNSLLDPALIPKKVNISSTGRKVIGLAAVLSDPQYLKDPDTLLTVAQQKYIVHQVLKMSYPGAPDTVIEKAVSAYPHINATTIAPAAFESYKAKQKFKSMLFMKVAKGTVQTMHFTDLNTVIDKLKLGTLYVCGEQRGMSLQVTIR